MANTNDVGFRATRAEDPLEIVDAVTALVIRQPPGDTAYRAPDEAEANAGVEGLARLRASTPESVTHARTVLSPLGFTVICGTDPTTGRPYAMALSELGTPRAWGLYLVDLSTPAAPWCIAVPHTRSDRNCQKIALHLWRGVPGSVLMMATVHRKTDWPGPGHPSTADPTFNTQCLFYRAWTRVFGPEGDAQVQIHGFALSDHTELTPGTQVVVSAGGDHRSTAVDRIVDAMNRAGLEDPPSTTRAAIPGWAPEARDLNADKNVQGQYARADGRNLDLGPHRAQRPHP